MANTKIGLIARVRASKMCSFKSRVQLLMARHWSPATCEYDTRGGQCADAHGSVGKIVTPLHVMPLLRSDATTATRIDDVGFLPPCFCDKMGSVRVQYLATAVQRDSGGGGGNVDSPHCRNMLSRNLPTFLMLFLTSRFATSGGGRGNDREMLSMSTMTEWLETTQHGEALPDDEEESRRRRCCLPITVPALWYRSLTLMTVGATHARSRISMPDMGQ